MYADAVEDKTDGLHNCVGFIDGTVIGIARPTRYETQMVAYNGHKRLVRMASFFMRMDQQKVEGTTGLSTSEAVSMSSSLTFWI